MKIDVTRLSGKARQYADQIIKSDGSLYAGKPRKATGEAKYVWRMVAFQVSPNPQHHCMPITADWDINIRLPNGRSDHDAIRECTRQLDLIVEEIVDNIPKDQWHGIKRWAQAYGISGTPRYTTDGSIIYR